jgi:hypothetical protein
MTVLAVSGLALPASISASAQDRTVIIKKDRGHHYGWRHHNAKVVIIKKHRDHD